MAVVLAVSFITSQTVPAYHAKEKIEQALQARDLQPKEPSNPPSSDTSFAEVRPETERDYLNEREKVLRARRKALGSIANSNAARDYAAELKFLEEEKKEEDSRRALTNRLFNDNAGRIRWGTFTIAYLVICGIAICGAIFAIIKVVQGKLRGRVIAIAVFFSVGLGLLAPWFSNYWVSPGLVGSTIGNDWPRLIGSLPLYEMLIVGVGVLMAIACAILTWGLPFKRTAATPTPATAATPTPATGEQPNSLPPANEPPLAPIVGAPPAAPPPDGANASAANLPANTPALALVIPADTNPPVDEVMEELKKRGRMLRILLYLAAAVLVARVFQSNAFVSWALSYLDLQGINTAFDGFLRSVITQESIGYTVVLAALYLPAFLVLRERATQYVESTMTTDPQSGKEGPTDPASFLKENGLTFSIREQLPRIITILSPLLVGPTAALLGKLIGGAA
ncbi:MAG TPA: hypothetical protein VJ464_20350 [Blastocatellia bacterium]|nr:hypothetical protein [Blastocatellia bacterium]